MSLKVVPGKKMDGAHHRPDQAFDVPAIMRRRDRTVDKANPIFFRASLKRARAKLLAIVDVNGVRKPACGPINFDSEPGKTSLLRQHEVLDRQRNRRDGRRLQRQIETRDHPARHVDRQRQPRPLQRLAERPIDDDDVDQRVIDLDDLISVLGKVFSGDRAKAIRAALAPSALS